MFAVTMALVIQRKCFPISNQKNLSRAPHFALEKIFSSAISMCWKIFVCCTLSDGCASIRGRLECSLAMQPCRARVHFAMRTENDSCIMVEERKKAFFVYSEGNQLFVLYYSLIYLQVCIDLQLCFQWHLVRDAIYMLIRNN